MDSEYNFTSLKEVYDSMTSFPSRIAAGFFYRGQMFTSSWTVSRHYESSYHDSVIQKKIITFDEPHEMVIIRDVYGKVLEWYSPRDVTSPVYLRPVMAGLIRSVMNLPKFDLDVYDEVIFVEAIKRNIKDAVELWDYIRSSGIAIENQAFIERISDGLQR